jgi:hypothetical protein
MTHAPTNHPSSLDLSRALAEGGDPGIDAHLAGCDACAEEWAAFRRVDGLARELAVSPPPAARVDERLTAILATVGARTTPAATSHRRPARWAPRLAVVATPLALAAAILLWVRGSASDGVLVRPTRPAMAVAPASAPTFRGSIAPRPGARFERVASAPRERVRLHDGAIAIDVAPLRAGESFHVEVGADEVDVHGTSFEVAASTEVLRSVVVFEGVVEVRPAGLAAVVLHAGERWDRPTAPAPTAPRSVDEESTARAPVRVRASREPGAAPARPNTPVEPAPFAPVEPAATAPRTETAPRPPTAALPADRPMARMFDRGWNQLRAGQLGAAATTFAEATAAYPRDPLAEDASFWRAVALARGKRAGAVDALGGFLDRYPRSARKGEASAMLGWILLERGDVDGAERRFRAAADDPVQTVRTSARRGLEAVAASR